MERARFLPLTISSPAVLLGARSTSQTGNGYFVTEDEMCALSQAIEPHLRLFRLLKQYDNAIVPPYSKTPDTNPTLFCTYLKPGFLHIIAFALTSKHNDARPSGYIMDSLPLTLTADTNVDLINRMRVVLALFTLQRRVVRICDTWNSICWPHDVLIEEHEAIVEVTGISTPTPSADVVDLEAQGVRFLEMYTVDAEDDPEYMKGVIATSVERVSAWLADLNEDQKLNEVQMESEEDTND
ncbi:hypothetical protein EIP86_003471 [Pleurotus ostreatoroseus]|nr:hypothetical protein EIP86_003471 [Pleurotus ostreatoroseus]